MLTEDDVMKSLLQTMLHEVLDAEMDVAIRAGRSERVIERFVLTQRPLRLNVRDPRGETGTGRACSRPSCLPGVNTARRPW